MHWPTQDSSGWRNMRENTNDPKVIVVTGSEVRILNCQFCFENPCWPVHRWKSDDRGVAASPASTIANSWQVSFSFTFLLHYLHFLAGKAMPHLGFFFISQSPLFLLTPYFILHTHCSTPVSVSPSPRRPSFSLLLTSYSLLIAQSQLPSPSLPISQSPSHDDVPLSSPVTALSLPC